jgi:hypothetical protein
VSNHVFPRPCRDPSGAEVFVAARILTHRPCMVSFATLSDAFHGDAVAAGWHHDIGTGQPRKRNFGEMLMLAVSELAEGMEGHRKGRNDDKLPDRPMLEVELADFIIRCFDTVNVKPLTPRMWHHEASFVDRNVGACLLHICHPIIVADSYIRSMEYAEASHEIGCAIAKAFAVGRDLALDLPGALRDKRAFNRTRSDHSMAARSGLGGKAY